MQEIQITESNFNIFFSFLQKKVALSDNLTFYYLLIFLLSANLLPYEMQLKCGVFLLLPNLPADELANLSDFYGVSSPENSITIFIFIILILNIFCQ